MSPVIHSEFMNHRHRDRVSWHKQLERDLAMPRSSICQRSRAQCHGARDSDAGQLLFLCSRADHDPGH
jgi:hypothetical protein